jgi:hypothetical protein
VGEAAQAQRIAYCHPVRGAMLIAMKFYNGSHSFRWCDVILIAVKNSIHFLRLDQLNERGSYMALLKEREGYLRLVYTHHTPTRMCAQVFRRTTRAAQAQRWIARSAAKGSNMHLPMATIVLLFAVGASGLPMKTVNVAIRISDTTAITI